MTDFSYMIQKAHQKTIISNKIDLSRNVLISAGADLKLRTFRLNDLQPISSINVQIPMKSALISTEKNKIIVATTNSKILFFDLIPFALQFNYQLPINEPERLWIDPQFKFLIIIDKSATLLSLDIETKAALLKINIPWINSNLVEFDRDGRNIFAFSKKNKMYKVRIGTAEIIKEYSIGMSSITKFSVNDEENKMIILSNTDLLKIDLINNKVLTIKKLENVYDIFVWDDHHGLILLGGEDGRVLILKSDDFEVIEFHQFCVGNITSIDLAPNGLIYSAGTNLGEIGVFPIHQGINLQDEINKFESMGTFYESEFEENEDSSSDRLEYEEEIEESNEMLSENDLLDSHALDVNENMENIQDHEYCKLCGERLGTEGEFCPSCGAKR